MTLSVIQQPIVTKLLFGHMVDNLTTLQILQHIHIMLVGLELTKKLAMPKRNFILMVTK